MLAITTRNEVKYLFSQGNSQREIAKILKISVISVRKILREESRDEKSELTTSSELDDKKVALLKTLVVRCRGNLIRVHEILQEEYGEAMPYSTLTYLVRQHKLREKDEPKRAGIYHFQPGEEMHWDTYVKIYISILMLSFELCKITNWINLINMNFPLLTA